MSYELGFHPDALEEWGKPDKSVRDQFKKKLDERLLNPRVPASRMSGQKDRFKIEVSTLAALPQPEPTVVNDAHSNPTQAVPIPA